MVVFDMQKHSIGQTIAALRKEKGWTQVQLAEMLQISDKAVSKWEKDKSCPGIDLLPALSDLFDVSIDYLVTGKNSEHSITIMSRIEYCAKTDNPKLAEEIDLSVTDETGKISLIIFSYTKLQEFLIQSATERILNLTKKSTTSTSYTNTL